MQPIDLEEKFGRVREHWIPRVLAELNGQEVKIAKVEGEFVPHRHEHADELFFVVRGRLEIRFPEARGAGAASPDPEAANPDAAGPTSAAGGGAGEPGTVRLEAGQLLVVPRGVLHQPVAEEEAWILLFEPAGTLNTGDVRDGLTVESPERI